jgi:hypothetical protein
MVSGVTGSPGTENYSSYYQNDRYPRDDGLFEAPRKYRSDEQPGYGDNEKAKEQPVGKDNFPERNKRLPKSEFEASPTRNFF